MKNTWTHGLARAGSWAKAMTSSPLFAADDLLALDDLAGGADLVRVLGGALELELLGGPLHLSAELVEHLLTLAFENCASSPTICR